jgi:hypothetical protein
MCGSALDWNLATGRCCGRPLRPGLTVRGKRRSIAPGRHWRQIASQGGFDDTTSAEKAADADGTRSDHRVAANPTNATPGQGEAGRISEAWPLIPRRCNLRMAQFLRGQAGSRVMRRVICPTTGKSVRFCADALRESGFTPPKSLARKNEICATNQGDLGRPDGRTKISRFSPTLNRWFIRAIPPRQEGRMRYRHET